MEFSNITPDVSQMYVFFIDMKAFRIIKLAFSISAKCCRTDKARKLNHTYFLGMYGFIFIFIFNQIWLKLAQCDSLEHAACAQLDPHPLQQPQGVRHRERGVGQERYSTGRPPRLLHQGVRQLHAKR